MTNAIRLKPGRDKSMLNRHPWIFSGGIQSIVGSPEPGEVVEIQSSVGQRLGSAFYNPHSQISLRVITDAPAGLLDRTFWMQRLDQCLSRRNRVRQTTNAFRVVYGESDGFPGLVIDVLADIVVVQLSSLGVESLRDIIQDWIVLNFNPAAIIERSDSPSLKAEGMNPRQALWWGTPSGAVEINAGTLRYWADPVQGQKTGFFIDQRDNRRRVAELGSKSLLNLFSYSGGFTVPAALNGASTVSVDSSEPALALVHENLTLNGVELASHETVADDVFEFLRQHSPQYEMVIVDPPALVKRRTDIDKAARAYKDVNRLALKRVLPGGYMLTCSCSQFVDWTLFRQILFAAGVESGRDVQVVGQFTQPEDHPVSLYFPEGEYLKTALLRVF